MIPAPRNLTRPSSPMSPLVAVRRPDGPHELFSLMRSISQLAQRSADPEATVKRLFRDAGAPPPARDAGAQPGRAKPLSSAALRFRAVADQRQRPGRGGKSPTQRGASAKEGKGGEEAGEAEAGEAEPDLEEMVNRWADAPRPFACTADRQARLGSLV